MDTNDMGILPESKDCVGIAEQVDVSQRPCPIIELQASPGYALNISRTDTWQTHSHDMLFVRNVVDGVMGVIIRNPTPPCVCVWGGGVSHVLFAVKMDHV